jgi:hypothetical protein
LTVTYGDSLASIAERFDVDYDSLQRHAQRHLSASQRAALLTATKPSEVDIEKLTKSESEGLLASLVAMRARLAQHAQAAAASGDIRTAVHCERVTVTNLELVARLIGQLINRSEVTHAHLTLSPSYLNLRQALVSVLRPYPEIAAKVAAALHKIEAAEGAEITAKAAKTVPAMIEHQAVSP